MDKFKNTIKRIIGAKHFKRYLVGSLVLIIGVSLILTSALGGSAPDVVESPSIEHTPAPEGTDEVEQPTPTPDADIYVPELEILEEWLPVNQLTGEPMDIALTRNRPFAFVLNNMVVALPQAGVSHVDILYEFPVEGGITRMLAIIQDISELDTIGSMRSARYYFVSVAESYDAIFAHAGDSYVARAHMSNRGTDNLNGVAGAARFFMRDPARRSSMGFEHSMMAVGERLYEGIPNFGFRTVHESDFNQTLLFTENAAPTNGGAAREITARITASKNSYFTYYPEYGQYFMRQFNRDFIDSETDERVGFTNILLVHTSVTARPGDRAGLRMVETTGEGTGFFINGGRYTEIRWSRADETAPFEYTLLDGSPLYLGVGRTFIGIVPRELEHDFS